MAVDYLLQAAQAVAEGHVKGVVHRDIKPSNLFLTKRADGTALIKVLDFGIAKTTEAEQPESSALTSSDDVRLGSPAYSSPEQLQNPRDVDKRSDIWSLGATLYELLSGRPPFEGNGYLELATRILKDPPTPISTRDLPHPLPAGLERVVRKCLEKQRSQRYANAAELAAALAPFGSEDARMSLTRVSGMMTSQSSFPAISKAVPVDVSTDLEPTLDVAGHTGRDRRTSDLGAVASEPPPAKRKSWLVVALAAAAIAIVVGLRTVQSPNAAARGTPVPGPAAAKPLAPAFQEPATPPLVPPSAGSSPNAGPIAPASSSASAPVASLSPSASAPSSAAEASKPSGGRAPGSASPTNQAMAASEAGKTRVVAPLSAATRAPVRQTEPASLKVLPAGSGEAAAKAGETAPSPDSSAGSSLGRSEEIERLIEERR